MLRSANALRLPLTTCLWEAWSSSAISTAAKGLRKDAASIHGWQHTEENSWFSSLPSASTSTWMFLIMFFCYVVFFFFASPFLGG